VKRARADHDVEPLLLQRWSPYRFTGEVVPEPQVRSLFESARWAASCYNDQPWYYIVVSRTDRAAFDEALSCLVSFNQSWACEAGLLAFGLYRERFAGRDEANPAAAHDLGQASAMLALQAAAMGLQAHQMLGILPDRIRARWRVPDGFCPLTAIAVGRPGEAPADGKLAERDKTPRERRPLREFVFGNRWDEPF
jgi:nitroreductase